MSDVAIETRALTKDYAVGFWRPRPRRVVDALTLTCTRGEIVGLLGPNGAGKSTTLKILAGLVFPTSGEARLLGKPPGARATLADVGYLPEQPAFPGTLTAEDVLDTALRLHGERNGASRHGRADAVLDRVGIGAERRVPTGRLSKGELQRVGLARALVHEPTVLLLDEPMSGLDPNGRLLVRELLLQVRDEGRTVFLSSHILPDAEALCGRVAMLAAGRLITMGALSELGALAPRGWELIVEAVSEAALDGLGLPTEATRLDANRWRFRIDRTARPEPLVDALRRAGARLVSLEPRMETLEEAFLRYTGTTRGLRGHRADPPEGMEDGRS
ncbi:MAG: ATP-binding cassette domain-containing protein [Luteitalea sp.]|nr:ATP-binding cassette domain-containing protein [Luteitalea sp.]